ncbi:putative GED domain-containing protein [Seiridium cardinale]|uniref:GED domain-containing protein n=1 Tax=Seiridium cardinale TaxID=138064 RepID=A0ABR2XF26_9PEZI
MPGDQGSEDCVEMSINATLKELQTDELRLTVDTFNQMQEVGLEDCLLHPQIVVFGDQSAEKSSVLEALTEIPFPRNDHFCTRFATEIHPRQKAQFRVKAKIIPNSDRALDEQKRLRNFSVSITDLKDLAVVTSAAVKAMGIATSEEESGSPFSRDILRVEVDGPDKPHLTLVDIPGLIQAPTKGVFRADIALVSKITECYLGHRDTISPVVISSNNPAACQPILEKIQELRPSGGQTLGVITKPDTLSKGSGSEKKFLQLARNEDVFFELGWHVIKNRSFEERNFSVHEQDISEMEFFRASNFGTLPKEAVGIHALRLRLGQLVVEQMGEIMPYLQECIENAIEDAQGILESGGNPKYLRDDCLAYLKQVSMDYNEIVKAGLQGNYRNDFFKLDIGASSSPDSDRTFVRLRAAVQCANQTFDANLKTWGHKYTFDLSESQDLVTVPGGSKVLSKETSMAWISRELSKSRGSEPFSNFIPHVVAELFWKQSEAWEGLSHEHVEHSSQLCQKFLSEVLGHVFPHEAKSRIWSTDFMDAMKKRSDKALGELEKIVRDKKSYPVSYSHYYIEKIQSRLDAGTETLDHSILLLPDSYPQPLRSHGERPARISDKGEVNKVHKASTPTSSPYMELVNCEEALDSLLAIYKVQREVFVVNVTTQVIERHIMRGLETILSPTVVDQMYLEISDIVSEPEIIQKVKLFVLNRINKLEDGYNILDDIFGGIDA